MGIQERRQRELARREREILDAALGLFDTDEWLSVTVEQIANAAEVGKGTVYKHFDSKEALYGRLALDFYAGLFLELQAVALEGEVPVLFRELVVRALRYHVNRPEYRRVVQYCKRADFKNSASPVLIEQFQALDRRFQAFSETLIRRGMAEGAFAERPVDTCNQVLNALFEGAVYMLWEGVCWSTPLDPEAFIQATAEFLLAGMRPAPNPAREAP